MPLNLKYLRLCLKLNVTEGIVSSSIVESRTNLDYL
jgi:hypothetical protein